MPPYTPHDFRLSPRVLHFDGLLLNDSVCSDDICCDCHSSSFGSSRGTTLFPSDSSSGSLSASDFLLSQVSSCLQYLMSTLHLLGLVLDILLCLLRSAPPGNFG